MADLRRCIGSAKFGIEAHDAPPEDFPVQPSQKDGLGRMCKPHWREYTNALRKAALARKAADAEREAEPGRAAPRPARGRTTPPTVRKAKALIDAIDVLPGPEHVAAIATDEAQTALEVLSEHVAANVKEASIA